MFLLKLKHWKFVMLISKILFIYCLCSAEREGQERNGTFIFALRPLDCKDIGYHDGIPLVTSGKTTYLRVFGNNLTSESEIGFTDGDQCDYPVQSALELSDTWCQTGEKGVVTFTPSGKETGLGLTKYYVCLKGEGEDLWQHQGMGEYVTIYVDEQLYSIPPWITLLPIILCYSLSALMTGLNLGLMSLEYSELQLIKKAGSPKERKYAEKIIPIRKNGNFLVCSIVITSTLCNTCATVLTDEIASEFVTVIVTTVIIVLFCEILPQSICSTYPLYVGAQTVYITRTCMFITFPISYPVSRLLNCVIGQELAKNYNKDRLKQLLKRTNLPDHEEKIIAGTLDFGDKKVEDIMTHIEDIFKLPITAVMNFETIAAILASGYSRVPIYVGDKSNIRYVLLTKDLALLDPDEEVPVTLLVQKTKSTCRYVTQGTTLDKVLELFKDTHIHMLFVTDDDSDAKSVIGLLTFEDLLEEIFQMEILDETDTIFDNRGKRRVSFTQKTDLISMFLQPTKAVTPSENVKLSTYCFLSEIEEFAIQNVSPKVLITVINMDIYYTTKGTKLPQDTIYVRGVPADYFIMILEGQMNVKIGIEELAFECGPFRYFGVEALRKLGPFTPDYTLQGVNKTLYIKIPYTLYNAALLATKFERFSEIPGPNTKNEVKRYFNIIVGIESPTPTTSTR